MDKITDKEVDEIMKKKELSNEDVEKLSDWVEDFWNELEEND